MSTHGPTCVCGDCIEELRGEIERETAGFVFAGDSAGELERSTATPAREGPQDTLEGGPVLGPVSADASGSDSDVWRPYRRVATVEARRVRVQEAVPSDVQVPKGHHPRPGDYLVRDPERPELVWLVTPDNFERWYEAIR